jgi:hypothetical protein
MHPARTRQPYSPRELIEARHGHDAREMLGCTARLFRAARLAGHLASERVRSPPQRLELLLLVRLPPRLTSASFVLLPAARGGFISPPEID